jgi:transcriptional regulator with XRE-family HTH domain
MFKDKLKELRQSKNISQATLADKIYVSRSAVAKWEQGRGLPTEDSLKLLCEYFNVSEDELLDKKEPLQICSMLTVDNRKKTNIIKLLILVICIFIVGGLVLLFSTGVIDFNNDGTIIVDDIRYYKQEWTFYDKDEPYVADVYSVEEIISDEPYITIPDEINGIPVWLFGSGQIESTKYNAVGIDIGNVYQIDGYGFRYWLNLKYIKMDNVKHMYTSIFSNCKSLEKIIFPKTMEDVHLSFNGCDSLKELYFLGNPVIQGDLGDKANDITIYGFAGSTAFEYAKNNGYNFITITNKILNEITEFQKYHEEKFVDTDDYVTIEGITYSCPRVCFTYEYIYIDGLQYQCILGLKESIPYDKADRIIIPDEIDIILAEAFNHGYLGESVHLNNVIEIFDGAFMHQWIKEINLSKVEKIGSAAFYYCANLKTITIPQTVKYIGGNAFLGTSLKEIYFEGNPEKIEKMGLPKGAVIYGIPGGTVEEYAKTYEYKFVDITKNS